jgi:predicted CXXCH cytochrome family protein
VRSLCFLALLALLLSAQQPVPAPADPPDWTDCLACHPAAEPELPRLSELRLQGLGPLPEMTCKTCHAPAELMLHHSDWRHPVRSVATHLACTDCHSAAPHSAQAPLPRPRGDYTADGCYTCHSGIRREFGLLSRHFLSPALQCRACHPAHEPLAAVLPPALLPGSVARNWLDSYDWQATNQLCLDCHPASTVLLSTLEGFATLNTVNYHALHVERGQVACVECHTPHGSLRPALLRSQLLTGEAFGYIQGMDGGSCAVTCHGVAHDDWSYTNNVR